MCVGWELLRDIPLTRAELPRQLSVIRWASANHHCSHKVIAGVVPCYKMVAFWQGHYGVKMPSICQVCLGLLEVSL